MIVLAFLSKRFFAGLTLSQLRFLKGPLQRSISSTVSLSQFGSQCYVTVKNKYNSLLSSMILWQEACLDGLRLERILLSQDDLVLLTSEIGFSGLKAS